MRKTLLIMMLRRLVRPPWLVVLLVLVVVGMTHGLPKLLRIHDELWPVINPASNHLGWYRFSLVRVLLDWRIVVPVVLSLVFVPAQMLCLIREMDLITPTTLRELLPVMILPPVLITVIAWLIVHGVGPAPTSQIVYGSLLTDGQHQIVGMLDKAGSILSTIALSLVVTITVYAWRMRPSWTVRAAAVLMILLLALRIFSYNATGGIAAKLTSSHFDYALLAEVLGTTYNLGLILLCAIMGWKTLITTR